MKIDITERWRGYAEVTDMAGNGEWIEIEVRTNARRPKVVLRLPIWSAVCIAGKVQKAVACQKQHVERMRLIAEGQGF